MKGEVMHAAGWENDSGNIYYYEDFDFPVDPDDRNYIQVYRNGYPMPMEDDCTPEEEDEEACVSFESFLSSGMTEKTSWKVTLYAESSPVTSSDIFTVDYYWNGKVIGEKPMLTFDTYPPGTTATSRPFQYPCNDTNDIEVWEKYSSGIRECTGSPGCAFTVQTSGVGNIRYLSLTGLDYDNDYYVVYNFDGDVKWEHFEVDGGAWTDYYPRFPITHIGSNDPGYTDSHKLEVFKGYICCPEPLLNPVPLKRCYHKEDVFTDEGLNSYKVSENTNYSCLTTTRVEDSFGGIGTIRSGAVLLNVSKGKGDDQLRMGPPNIYSDSNAWIVEAYDADDYYITYYTDMETNLLELAKSRDDDIDEADFGLDVYKVYYPNPDCLDWDPDEFDQDDPPYEEYDYDTCIDAFANTLTGGNECVTAQYPEQVLKCIEYTIPQAEDNTYPEGYDGWATSYSTRSFHWVTGSIYDSDPDLRADILEAVYTTRNGHIMYEKSSITGMASPNVVSYQCTAGNCGGTPQYAWRVYVDNGYVDPWEKIQPTMHAWNPWILDASGQRPTWYEDANGDPISSFGVAEDAFDVLTNIGFQSTSISLGTGGYVPGTGGYQSDFEAFLTKFIDEAPEPNGIKLYLHHALLAHWNLDTLKNTYDLGENSEEVRRNFWLDPENKLWNGFSYGDDDYIGILDHIEWMTSLVSGSRIDATMPGLELDFEPIAPYGSGSSATVGSLFFEPFFPYQEDDYDDLLDAIEKRGR